METYFDLVVCKMENGDSNAFEAPPWSKLKEDDLVIVATRNGKKTVKVIQVIETVNRYNQLFNTLLNCYNRGNPLKKVLCKVEYTEFIYDIEETRNA